MLEAVSLGEAMAFGGGIWTYDHVIVTGIGDNLGLRLSATAIEGGKIIIPSLQSSLELRSAQEKRTVAPENVLFFELRRAEEDKARDVKPRSNKRSMCSSAPLYHHPSYKQGRSPWIFASEWRMHCVAPQMPSQASRSIPPSTELYSRIDLHHRDPTNR